MRASVRCVITPRTSYSVLDVPLPVGGASAERCVGPATRSLTGPCTSPTRSTGVTLTVVEQAPVCGVASSFAAVSWHGVRPGRHAGGRRATVALAVPPSAVAGAKPVSVIVPAAGAGVTEPIVSEVDDRLVGVGGGDRGGGRRPLRGRDRGRARHGDRRVVGPA